MVASSMTAAGCAGRATPADARLRSRTAPVREASYRPRARFGPPVPFLPSEIDSLRGSKLALTSFLHCRSASGETLIEKKHTHIFYLFFSLPSGSSFFFLSYCDAQLPAGLSARANLHLQLSCINGARRSMRLSASSEPVTGPSRPVRTDSPPSSEGEKKNRVRACFLSPSFPAFFLLVPCFLPFNRANGANHAGTAHAPGSSRHSQDGVVGAHHGVDEKGGGRHGSPHSLQQQRIHSQVPWGSRSAHMLLSVCVRAHVLVRVERTGCS